MVGELIEIEIEKLKAIPFEQRTKLQAELLAVVYGGFWAYSIDDTQLGCSSVPSCRD